MWPQSDCIRKGPGCLCFTTLLTFPKKTSEILHSTCLHCCSALSIFNTSNVKRRLQCGPFLEPVLMERATICMERADSVKRTGSSKGSFVALLRLKVLDAIKLALSEANKLKGCLHMHFDHIFIPVGQVASPA